MMNILNNSGQKIPEADWAERCVYLRVRCKCRATVQLTDEKQC